MSTHYSFGGIYQVEVPITRSFRSVVPPGKMRSKIAMHLCALAESEDRKSKRVYLDFFLFRFPPLSIFYPTSTYSLLTTSLYICPYSSYSISFPPLPLLCVSYSRLFLVFLLLLLSSWIVVPRLVPRAGCVYRWNRRYHS